MKPFSSRAFSLIEIVAVAALIAILASVTLPGITDMILRNRITAEDAALKNLAASIRESFENADLDMNLGVVPVQNYLEPVDASQFPTSSAVHVFKTNSSNPDPQARTESFFIGTLPQYPSGMEGALPVYSNNENLGVNLQMPLDLVGNEWFVKLARVRGVSVSGVERMDRNTTPELAKIAFNASDRPRLLVVCPPTNHLDTSIRMMLISLMASPDQLQLPAIPNDPWEQRAWFNAIWDFNFDTYTSSLPRRWEEDMAWSSTERDKWRPEGQKSNLSRLRVERITLPLYSITLSNVHRSDVGRVYLNFSGNNLDAQSSLPINPVSDPVELRGIPAGRRVVVRRGPPGVENEVLRFTLRENADVAIQ